MVRVGGWRWAPRADAHQSRFAPIRLEPESRVGELTAAAKAFVDICVPSANNADSWAHIKRFILNSGAKAPSGCLEKVQAFMQKYDKTHAVLSEDTRRRLLRGADSQ